MAAGYMERAGGRVRLTEAGWLVSNEILADLI
jgi:coproporphyrinogen III oxidase-like Fe-S oxidoreductase